MSSILKSEFIPHNSEKRSHKCEISESEWALLPGMFTHLKNLSLWQKLNQIKSNQITFIVTSPQHKCLGEWNSYERAPDSAEKQQTIYIWTVHIYRLYRRQCAKYTYIYSVHIVYYKDTLNYQRHIIHRMGTSTLCTLSIHYVVYTVIMWGATDYKLTADWLSSR